MKQLMCPQCGNHFSVDEADYAYIVNQVKNLEFEKEIERRLNELKKQSEAEQEAERLMLLHTYQEQLNIKVVELSKKDGEIERLMDRLECIGAEKQAECDAEL